MKKKYILTALLMVTAATLFACGGKKESSESAGQQEVIYWHSMDGVFSEILDKQVADFNQTIGAEKNIKVTSVFQDWPGTQSLTTAMASDDIDNMPDVIQLYGESVSTIRDYDRTVWVEDYITKESSTIKKADLVPNAVASYSIDKKMIGLPYNVSSLMLYYNVDVLEEAGHSEAPTTLAELATVMTDVKKKELAKNALNVQVRQYELENWIATQGGDGSYFGNNSSGHEGSLTAFQAAEDGTLNNFLTEWEKVIATGGLKATNDSANEEFANGDNAMVIMSSSRIPAVGELVGDKFEWAVASIPTVAADDIGGAFPSGAGLFMLDRDNDERQAASWEFIQYMASPEAQAMWLDGTGYIPVNMNTLKTETYKEAIKNNPRLAMPYDSLIKSSDKVVAAFVPNTDGINTVIDDAMTKFANGDVNLEKTEKSIVEGIKKALDEYYRTNPID